MLTFGKVGHSDDAYQQKRDVTLMTRSETNPPPVPPHASRSTLTFVVELLQVRLPQAAGTKVDAELELLSLQWEGSAGGVAATAEDRKTSAPKREEAKAAADARLANEEEGWHI